MAEIHALQQVHSLSSVVEKVQQVQQQQGELHLKQVADQLVKKHESEKTEVVPFDEVANAVIREETEGGSGESGEALSAKKKNTKKTEEGDTETAKEEAAPSVVEEEGLEKHSIDIIV